MATTFPNGINWSTIEDTCEFGERLARAYLGNQLHSDMTFYVESENVSVPGHSLLVAAASPVLERCIHGSGTMRNPDRVVTIRDCSMSDFKILQKFLYSGKADIRTPQSAATLFPLAHYYDLTLLETTCLSYMQTHLNKSHVCKIFELIYFLDVDIANKCLDMIHSNIHELLQNGSVMEMHNLALRCVLDDKSFAIGNEIHLFKALLRWADGQCEAAQTPAMRRKILNDRLSLIQFGAMHKDEFLACVKLVGPDFFTAEEISSTMLRIVLGTAYDKSNTPAFGSKLRLPLVLDKMYFIKSDPPRKTANHFRTMLSVTQIQEFIIKYDHLQPGRRIESSANDSFLQRLAICTDYDYMPDINIVGLQLRNAEYVSKVFIEDGRGREFEIEFTCQGERIIFKTTVPFHNGTVIPLVIRSNRIASTKLVIPSDPANEVIRVQANTWSNVDRVMYAQEGNHII